jgi:hypothetical protein
MVFAVNGRAPCYARRVEAECSGAGMAHWQDRFLGIGELPPELSIFELEFFQFSPRDVAAIRKEFRPKYRIAVALQLGFMRMTGARLNAFNVVPRKLLSLVGEQVGENAPSIASLRSMYRRGNTRRDHQAWVMRCLRCLRLAKIKME